MVGSISQTPDVGHTSLPFSSLVPIGFYDMRLILLSSLPERSYLTIPLFNKFKLKVTFDNASQFKFKFVSVSLS